MSHKTYSAITIANEFLDLAKRDEQRLSPMKIQKLVYFAHAWMLGIAKEPLISDAITAWKFGPVIGSLYHEFKEFGAENITRYGTELSDDTDDAGFKEIIPTVESGDEKTKKLVAKIWKTYGRFSAAELSSLTHREGSPWDVTKEEHKSGRVSDYPLTNQVIQSCAEKEMAGDAQGE